MDNVVLFPHPNLSDWPDSSMSDHERELMVRTLRSIGSELTYPLNQILPRFSQMVQNYPVEDIIIKSLQPCGYLMSCNYAPYGLHWMLRLEGSVRQGATDAYGEPDIVSMLARSALAMGLPVRAYHFVQRFMLDLNQILLCDSIVSENRITVITGTAHASVFDHGGPDPYVPFTMVLTKR